jgi:nitroreductase
MIDIITVVSGKPQRCFLLTPSPRSDSFFLLFRKDLIMDLYEAIKGRRSIRKFRPDPIPREVLERILEMAIWAPSGMNLQNWYFVVMTGERKQGLVEIVSRGYPYIEPVLKEVFAEKPEVLAFTSRFFKRLGGAPVLVFAYYEPTKERPETSVQTVAAAIQNLLLAAHADGLGACWMTGPVHVAKQINEFLGIHDKTLVAVIPMGYPDESPPAPKRKPNRVVYEGF